MVSVLEGGYGRHVHKHKPKASPSKHKPKASPSKRRLIPKPEPQKSANPKPEREVGGTCKRARSRSAPTLLASDMSGQTGYSHVRFVVRGIKGRRLPFTPSPQKRRRPLWDDAGGAEPSARHPPQRPREAKVEAKVESATEMPMAKANSDPPRLTGIPEPATTDCMSLDRSYLANCCLEHVLTLVGHHL